MLWHFLADVDLLLGESDGGGFVASFAPQFLVLGCTAARENADHDCSRKVVQARRAVKGRRLSKWRGGGGDGPWGSKG